MLNKDDFLNVVKLTPLVAIDLIVTANNGSVLMGKRVNQPAAGYWFVPGGRIYKGETLEVAFQRITDTELGKAHHIEEGRLLGGFTHLYDTNFANSPGIGTHYVVLAYQIPLIIETGQMPTQQHQHYQWFSQDADLSEVHPNSRVYFSYLHLEFQDQ